LKGSNPCGCCGDAVIHGPFIGEVPYGNTKVGRYYQCWGDFNGRRCENTRMILISLDAEPLDERARKAGI
jgi:hypothetical protein